jgi:hypothetical protein
MTTPTTSKAMYCSSGDIHNRKRVADAEAMEASESVKEARLINATVVAVASEPRKRLTLRCKLLSLSFRAELMIDISKVMCIILQDDVVMQSLHSYTIEMGMFGDGEGALVFRFYEGELRRITASIEVVMRKIRESEEDVHVIAETLDFTDEYNGNRIGRRPIASRIAEKIGALEFVELRI